MSISLNNIKTKAKVTLKSNLKIEVESQKMEIRVLNKTTSIKINRKR